ncbi:MAG: type II toxin-antitoxin system VapC family toxin [Pseudomonadota bacterium]
MILLDTNVISETMRKRCDEQVLEWLDTVEKRDLLICTPVLAELYAGIGLQKDQDQKDRLRYAVQRFINSVLINPVVSFDAACAQAYGEIVAKRTQLGRPIASMDAQIAAVADVSGASVATRNVKDFEHLNLNMINPFEQTA